jgi:hypothetical protein
MAVCLEHSYPARLDTKLCLFRMQAFAQNLHAKLKLAKYALQAARSRMKTHADAFPPGREVPGRRHGLVDQQPFAVP